MELLGRVEREQPAQPCGRDRDLFLGAPEFTSEQVGVARGAVRVGRAALSGFGVRGGQADDLGELSLAGAKHVPPRFGLDQTQVRERHVEQDRVLHRLRLGVPGGHALRAASGS